MKVNGKVSVVVCTYNRRGMLRGMLESARGLKVPGGTEWELVLVDNNSTDGTREMVEEYRGLLPVKYVREEVQGKTHALNRGLEEASGDLLLFTDDDVRLHPDWMQEYGEAAGRHSGAGWFGGRIEPLWEEEAPPWLKEESVPALSGYFVIYDLGEEHSYREGERPPVGANMAVRRTTFQAVGSYRTDLGPRGNDRGTGDETELIERAESRGIGGVYVPGALAWHLTPGDRLGFRSFFRFGLMKGANQYRMSPGRNDRGSYARAGSQFARGVYQMLKSRGDRARICMVNTGIEVGRRRASREGDSGTR
jgi:glycosyltransferase involved in cell wall biosynthesis